MVKREEKGLGFSAEYISQYDPDRQSSPTEIVHLILSFSRKCYAFSAESFLQQHQSCSFCKTNHGLLRNSLQPHQHLQDQKELEEFGFNPQRMQFVVATHVKIWIDRSTQERKEGIYKKWGWADHDFSAAFRAFPWCIVTSDNKIEAIMDFLVNKMGYKSSAIVKCPAVLGMSLEKRIIPRGSVIVVLMSKGLMKRRSLSSLFNCNEKVFLDKFVSCHENEADDLLKLYHAKIALAR